MRSGFVSFIGRPNVGKSTLLNALMTQKIAITSDKAGTTRNVIQGIYNEKDYQIIFVDTPGISKPINRLGRVLNKKAMEQIDDVDCILFVVDGKKGIGPGDKYILDVLKRIETPVVLVINKIDQMSKEMLIYTINEYKDLYPFADIVPVSAFTNDNTDRLIEVIKKYLKDEVKYFDDDMVTSNTMGFMVAEIVREKLLNDTIEEVPHSIACNCVGYEEKKDIVNILVDIIVDRDSIKKIVIGKNGNRLKKVGILAREEIEAMVGKKVYIELYVKTIKNWKDKEKYLLDLGYLNSDE
ncbi:MAG: GTPase Era [Firmicutes bacterium]|nr:GTPase Era [Bacillota bacterium]